MRRAILLALGLALVAGPAGAQGFIHYHSSVAGFACDGTTCTLTKPLLLASGVASAPGLAFSVDPDTGFVHPGVGFQGYWQWYADGNLSLQFQRDVIWLRGTSPEIDFGSSQDLILKRDAAATLQLGLDAATATAQTLKGSDSTGNAAAGGNLTLRGGAGLGTGNPVGGNLILGGGAPNGAGERGVVLLEDGGTRPTCAVGIRGAIWYDAGGVGAADSIAICAHKSDNSYAWVELATPIS